MSYVDRLKNQVGAQAVAGVAVISAKTVNPSLRPTLVKVLRASGSFVDVTSTLDTRGKEPKVYLYTRGHSADHKEVIRKVQEIAAKHGLAVGLQMTSHSGPTRKTGFRVTGLAKFADCLSVSNGNAKATTKASDLFDAMGSVQAAANRNVGVVVLGNRRYENVSLATMAKLEKVILADQVVQLSMLDVIGMSRRAISVPSVVAEAIKSKRNIKEGKWEVVVSQGVVVVTNMIDYPGTKLVLA